jgi:glyoxylase-like metal-dependent hydrolase (beta-lactamase superfamily II)
MTGPLEVISRRTFLRDLGHGAFAVTVIGIAACAPRAPGSFDPLTYAGNLNEIESFWCEDEPPSRPPPQPPDPDHAVPRNWARIGDPGAAGYILVRGGEATIVDTGPWCVPDLIEAGLMAVGLEWSAVSSVIVTHKHPDHWVGLPTALERAVDAVVYAGAADVPHIAAPRPVVAVGAGDRVMNLAIIPTPGHTPGHIVVHDEPAGVLVVGDAISNHPEQGLMLLGTSEDVPQTQESVRILGGLSFDTLLPGHGEPIVGGAWEQLTEYVADN